MRLVLRRKERASASWHVSLLDLLLDLLDLFDSCLPP